MNEVSDPPTSLVGPRHLSAIPSKRSDYAKVEVKVEELKDKFKQLPVDGATVVSSSTEWESPNAPIPSRISFCGICARDCPPGLPEPRGAKRDQTGTVARRSSWGTCRVRRRRGDGGQVSPCDLHLRTDDSMPPHGRCQRDPVPWPDVCVCAARH
jgi:hypothetical protein